MPPPKSKKFDDKPFIPDKLGTSDVGIGVEGISNSGTGVEGHSTSGIGVYGTSSTAEGIYGESTFRGVYGESTDGDGVFGHATGHGGRGVVGVSAGHTGVEGNSTRGSGVFGSSQSNPGVEAHSDRGPGVFAIGNPAGLFEGDVTVTGNITTNDVFVVGGGDCAEEFDIAEAVEIDPGTVMVLNPEGTLQPSQQAYDKRVAGVISGAGDYKPGLILDKKKSSEGRMPVALVGKVYCKVDAQYASIEVGDLLTTSPTLGHAMKADDPLKAFGSVIGKALRPLQAGQGLIPILIALQ